MKTRANEVTLLKKCLKGDPKAFEVIVAKYQELVCAITYSGIADVQQSEELAHQTFINAWKNLSQLKNLSRFRPWLCTIARNNIRNFINKNQRDIIAKAKPMENINDTATDESGPLESAIKKEHEALVSDAIQQVSEQYREPLVLYYRQQQSVKQVAISLDLSEDIVKQRLQRGRKMIKEQLSSIVEETLSATGPKKAFTTAVIASVAGMAIKGSGVAAAARIATATSTAGTATGVAAIMSGVTAKIITAATVVAIGVGAVVTYKHVTKPSEQGPALSQAAIIVQEQKKDQSLQRDQYNGADRSFAKSAVDEIENENHETSLNEDISPESQEQGTSESISRQSNEPEMPKTGISGVVINKFNSMPIKGAQVFYGPRKNPKGSFYTDASGHFEFLDMKPRARQFFYIVAKDFTSRRITLDIVKDKVYENFKIELTPGSKVAGVVYGQNDKPIKGATVGTFQFTNHPAVTDANGTFEIDGLDPAWGQYSLHVTHPNYPAFSTRFSPANAGEAAWKDVVLKPGVTVYGQVTDVQGRPVAKVSIGNTTSRAMWNCISTKTDLEGKYELRNIDVGELVLWAIVNEYAPYVERFTLDSSEAKKLINIQLSDPLPLHGKIVDKQGNPVASVSISIREYKGVSNLTNWRDRVSSDSMGKFVIPNAPSTGTVILSVWAKEVPNTHPELEAGQEEEYVIEVDRAGRVYGKVVDDKTGEPIKRFNVKLTFSKNGSKPGWGYSATWNREGHNFDSAEGVFDTGRENIPVGAEYSLTVYADGFDPLTIDPVAVQPITISNNPKRTEFRLKLASAIAGRVVDSNSIPIAGARIRILSDNTDFEHWDDRDTTVANSKGEFILSGVGLQERCIYITAEAFAPYFGSTLDLPKDSEGIIQITMEPGAEVFGRVFDANGKGVADAKVSVHVFSELREFLRLSRLNLKQTTTDVDGYYEYFDLPAGSVSISVNSSTANGDLNIAQKKISLKAGQSVELNFGKEAGFTISGIVRAGEKPLVKASVQIRLPNESVKWGYTDNNGRFQIKGVPKGTYEMYTSYHSGFDPKTYQRGHRERLSDKRQVAIKGNAELDIDLGDGSVGGKIPEQFEEMDKLQILCRRKAPRISKTDTLHRGDWQYAGRGKLESNGRFKCSNLRAGQYYCLLVSEHQEVLGISDVFELAESEHLENITFNVGSGILQIHVVDAETLYGIPNAKFVIKNDLETIFYSKRFVPEDSQFGMIADDRGTVEYTDLPKGKYAVWVQTPGYLTTESEWVNFRDGEIRKITVPVERAAILSFELSEELKKRITADTVYLRCQVTNINTNELIPMVGPYREDEEHTVWLLPEEYAAQRQAAIKLPEGVYEIKYRLYQDRKGGLSYKVNPPLLEGTVNVEIDKGETKLVTVSE
jgi:RNA polymerase sigma factor (sigma-70 family)